jgi:threonine aldolase
MQATRDEQAIRQRCTRFLAHHHPRSPREVLFDVAEATPTDAEADIYGSGAVINDFEAEVARLLGKEAAVVMPSGTMASPIALRVWADRRHSPNVAMHPRNHLDQPERHGYQRLHGLQPILIGNIDTQLRLKDVEAISEPLAALFLELPQRELGGRLPEWDELAAMTDWARSRDIPLHMDGARLWECASYYGRGYAEIAGLFDSVYVSLYKILGGIAGSALAGPADVIAEAKVWLRRHGGNLIHLYPLVISARIGMERHLPNIDAYCRRAREIALVLGVIPGIEVAPEPPQTNMMHVYLLGDAERLMDAALDVSEQEGVWLYSRLQSTPRDRWQRFELSIGSAALDLTDAEIDGWFRRIMEHAAR